MITALDTNILLDVLADDPRYSDASAALIEQAAEVGALAICEIVYAELSPRFSSQAQLDSTLRKLGIELSPSGKAELYLAGQNWRKYRASGGPRTRILADFLIGAHASLQAGRLLTRDRGFYHRYFPTLRLME
jgi:predicted nucleic acid-binding protein